MSVGVSIVSYNTKDLLRTCLLQLKRQTFKNINVWVLDNNSQDGSVEMVRKDFAEVKLIQSSENLGFAKGHNIILRQIKDEYALVLNPDTNFSENIIEEMINFMEKYSFCEVASCKLVGNDGVLHSNGGNFPIGSSFINWLYHIKPLFTFGLSQPNFHRLDKKYYEKEHEVDWVSGTFMMIRSDVFKKVGFFDENYFMYFEDVDFCYRVKQAKLKIMLNPKVAVKHIGGASSKNPRFAQWKGEFQGLIRFYNKNFGMIIGLTARIFVYVAIILRVMAFFLTGKRGKAKTYGQILFEL